MMANRVVQFHSIQYTIGTYTVPEIFRRFQNKFKTPLRDGPPGQAQGRAKRSRDRRTPSAASHAGRVL